MLGFATLALRLELGDDQGDAPMDGFYNTGFSQPLSHLSLLPKANNFVSELTPA
jgi:hypothetical protein